MRVPRQVALLPNELDRTWMRWIAKLSRQGGSTCKVSARTADPAKQMARIRQPSSQMSLSHYAEIELWLIFAVIVAY